MNERFPGTSSGTSGSWTEPPSGPRSQMRETEALGVHWLSQPGLQSWELPPGMLTPEPGGTTEGFRPPASVVGTCPLHIIRHQEP